MKKGIEFVSVYHFRIEQGGLFSHQWALTVILSFLLYSLDFSFIY